MAIENSSLFQRSLAPHEIELVAQSVGLLKPGWSPHKAAFVTLRTTALLGDGALALLGRNNKEFNLLLFDLGDGAELWAYTLSTETTVMSVSDPEGSYLLTSGVRVSINIHGVECVLRI